MTRNIGINTRRFQHTMQKYIFDDKNPIECLRFLSVFKKQLDDNGIAEGGALKIRPSFVSGDALDSCDSHNEERPASFGGFNISAHAVNHVLRTYAKDEH